MRVENDPRYTNCTSEGKTELSVYVNWIEQNGLPDSEFSFVAYALGRAQLKHPRDIYQLWESIAAETTPQNVRVQTRRFLMNPSKSINFSAAETAGWFNFLPAIYQAARSKAPLDVLPPSFVKVGFPRL